MATRTSGSARRDRTRSSSAASGRKRRVWVLGGGVALVTVLVVVAAIVAGGRSGRATGVSVQGAPASGVGSSAPAFSMPTLEGSRFDYPTHRPTLLYFMAGWCGTCVPEAAALARLQPALSGRALLVAVDADPSDSLGSLRSFYNGVGSPDYTFAKDDGQVDQAFGVNSLDITIVIDSAGRVVHRSVGGLDDSGLRSALAKAGVAV